MTLRVVFRADASIQIGTGHVMRCLTLAKALRDRGHLCEFICRNHQGNLGETIANNGFSVRMLNIGEQSGPNIEDHRRLEHSDWLGASWQEDADQVLSILADLKADWVVADHYALDGRWERRISNAVSRILVIDDLADRQHQADILLDQNTLGVEAEESYRELVNRQCQLFLGPQYALLGQEYRILASALPPRDGQISRVLIFVGGSDPHHLTERYLEALARPSFKHLSIDVVIGKNHPSPDIVQQMVDRREGARLYSGLSSLSALMIRADLMLGAGGATNWERMCVGLPAILVSVARNQDKINQELADLSLVRFLGCAEAVTAEDISRSLESVLEDAHANAAQSKAMRALVDGNGTQQLIEAMEQGLRATA